VSCRGSRGSIGWANRERDRRNGRVVALLERVRPSPAAPSPQPQPQPQNEGKIDTIAVLMVPSPIPNMRQQPSRPLLTGILSHLPHLPIPTTRSSTSPPTEPPLHPRTSEPLCIPARTRPPPPTPSGGFRGGADSGSGGPHGSTSPSGGPYCLASSPPLPSRCRRGLQEARAPPRIAAAGLSPAAALLQSGRRHQDSADDECLR
jgi:hypothetical protein